MSLTRGRVRDARGLRTVLPDGPIPRDERWSSSNAVSVWFRLIQVGFRFHRLEEELSRLQRVEVMWAREQPTGDLFERGAADGLKISVESFPKRAVWHRANLLSFSCCGKWAINVNSGHGTKLRVHQDQPLARSGRAVYGPRLPGPNRVH